jgi:hypothetical protein
MRSLDTFLPTLRFYPEGDYRRRLFALWYFTILLIVWTLAGHLVLGFEQAYAHPFAGVAAACAAQFLLEWVDAQSKGRRPRYMGGVANFIHFLPPPIIPGLACAMLIYPNARIGPIVFAAVLSIASKVLLRAPIGNGQTQHIFNPSNFGITVTLLCFPSVGLAPPYQFTENVTGFWHFAIPALILMTGIVMHGKFTGRLPLVLAWLGGFAAQGLIRAAVFGIPARVPFVPMTSAAFILFTLYMIPDPATTPLSKRRQVFFGLAIASVYGLLFVMHVVYGLFIALAAVSAVRGIALHVAVALAAPARKPDASAAMETA